MKDSPIERLSWCKNAVLALHGGHTFCLDTLHQPCMVV